MFYKIVFFWLISILIGHSQTPCEDFKEGVFVAWFEKGNVTIEITRTNKYQVEKIDLDKPKYSVAKIVWLNSCNFILSDVKTEHIPSWVADSIIVKVKIIPSDSISFTTQSIDNIDNTLNQLSFKKIKKEIPLDFNEKIDELYIKFGR